MANRLESVAASESSVRWEERHGTSALSMVRDRSYIVSHLHSDQNLNQFSELTQVMVGVLNNILKKIDALT
jgi:hypothetical protein